MEGYSTLGGLMKLIKGCLEEGEQLFDHLLIGPWHFWRAFACPLHNECSLSLLVNQF